MIDQALVERARLGDREAYERLAAKVWNLYFLVPTGRGQFVSDMTPPQYDEVLASLYRIQRKYDRRMLVNAKCAPHYIKTVLENNVVREGPEGSPAERDPRALDNADTRRDSGPPDGIAAYGSSPITQLSCGTGGTWNSDPACSSTMRLSVNATAAAPARTRPTCSTSHRTAPTDGPTSTDHFQPGAYVARPIVIPPTLTTSNRPRDISRTSSGSSNRLRITSAIIASSENNPGSAERNERALETVEMRGARRRARETY